MEAQYYSAKLVSFPPVCYYCRLPVPEEFLVNDKMVELKWMYAVVRPICLFCKAEGKKVFTSHQSNIAKKRKVN